MSDTDGALLGQELYRGNVNTWECDEMGHMNVRFYVAKAQEAMAILGHLIGIGPGHQRTIGTALTVTDHHIRFLRELHAGSGVYACGGIVDSGEDWFRAYIEIREALSHQPSATFNTLVCHTDPDMGARIPLPASCIASAHAERLTIPDHGLPRGLTLEAPRGDATLTRAAALGMVPITQSVVQDHQCNENALMQTQHFIGKVSDGIVNLLPTFQPGGVSPREPGRVGGAAVEYRLCYHKRPRAGDIVTVRSGLKAVGERTMTMAHWILDGVTGQPLATSEAVALTLDLDTRRSMAFPTEVRQFMEGKIIPGLSA